MARTRTKAVAAQAATTESPADTSAPVTPANDIFDEQIEARKRDAAQTAALVLQVAESTRMPDAEREAAHENGHAANHAPHRDAGQSHASSVGKREFVPTPDPFGIVHDLLAGVRLSESRRFRKMLIAFDEKPTQAVIDTLKESGFRWEQADKVWTHPVREETARQDRIHADRVFTDVSKAIRTERGIEHSVGVMA